MREVLTLFYFRLTCQSLFNKKEQIVKQKMTNMIGTRVPKELHAAFVKKVAKEKGHNASTLVRQLIQQYTFPTITERK